MPPPAAGAATGDPVDGGPPIQTAERRQVEVERQRAVSIETALPDDVPLEEAIARIERGERFFRARRGPGWLPQFQEL